MYGHDSTGGQCHGRSGGIQKPARVRAGFFFFAIMTFMDELQERIDTYYKKEQWSYWSPHEILARLVEETGELAREINHVYGPKKKKDTEQEKVIKDEVGDILYTLSCLATVHGFSLTDALESSINKVEERDKGRFRKEVK